MKTLNLEHYPQYVKQFRDYITTIFPISDEAWNSMVKIMTLKRVKKGVRILDYMEIESALRFLGKGIVKCEDNFEGKKFILDFRVAPIAICESNSIIYKTPSEITLETSTECDFIELPRKDLLKMAHANIEIARFSMFRIASYLELMHYKLSLLRTFTAEERYKQFLKEFPSVALNCKQTEIASYLNIKPESFSRIRKGIVYLDDEKELKALSNEISVLEYQENLNPYE